MKSVAELNEVYESLENRTARCVKCGFVLTGLESGWYISLFRSGSFDRKDMICNYCRDGKPRPVVEERPGFRKNILGNWVKVDD